jgi:hypothetical protein
MTVSRVQNRKRGETEETLSGQMSYLVEGPRFPAEKPPAVAEKPRQAGRSGAEAAAEVAYLGWWAVRDEMSRLRMRRQEYGTEYRRLMHERRMHARRCWELIAEIDRRVEEKFWP